MGKKQLEPFSRTGEDYQTNRLTNRADSIGPLAKARRSKSKIRKKKKEELVMLPTRQLSKKVKEYF